jgi:ribosomal protein S18 acetylase RimI-like enzyme
MSNIEVRNCTENDIPLFTQLSRKTFYETFAEQNTKEDMELFLDSSFTEELIRQEFNDPSNTLLIAFLDDVPVGCVKLSDKETPGELEDFDTIEIARIYSLKEMIGKGVGKAMMEACIATALEKNKDVIWLGVWEHNPRAISFYQKFGFEKFGEHDFKLGNDIQNDWLLMKRLK